AAAAAMNSEPDAPSLNSPAAPPVSTARIEELAEQILQEVQRRPDHHEPDFSISKLMAGIIQIVAIAAPLLAYFLYHASAEVALQLGIFLQAFTIALLIMGRQR
ncbi:MAG TPA: hypothetical protein VLJ39_00420, partial [Tepidisphaeraceae bacterium]|nr:hypothetical protein [Tepidisphaeraceae bacterium]